MTDINDTTEATSTNGAASDGELDQNNVLELIRRRRRDLLENRQTYIAIPGYEEIGLVAQYHLLDGKEMDGIVEKVRRQVKARVDRGLAIATDTLIAACDGLYLDQGNGTYVPFDPGHTGMPLNYGPELAQFLGIDGGTARRVVQGLFGENDTAIAMHSMKLNRWFGNTTREADEEFLLGEL